VGRSVELELIDSLLHRRDGIGPSLLLRGDAGVGKTALLDAAAAQAAASGMHVLRACGVEFEAEIPFASLHQMLYPVREHIDRLTSQQRDVLDEVLGLAPGKSPLALVAAAVLALLAEVAAERPVLTLIDDLPWIDEASMTVLGFMARRIGSEPVVLLAAARTRAMNFFHQVQLPERVIAPLAADPAAELLDARWPSLAPAVRRRLLAEAAGNPLVLGELLAALTDRQRSGHDLLPKFLPVSSRLEAIFAHAFDQLPAPARTVMLLAALEDSATLTTIRAATRHLAGVDDPAAAQADLIHIDPVRETVSFRHPLIRSAIVNLTPAGERRQAHEALATALAEDRPRRAWHLAEAASGPDEAVARALDEAALFAWRRGEPSGPGDHGPDEGPVPESRRVDASAAVSMLVRAGELSPHRADRSRRLVEAAYLATITGQLDQVDRLLADAGHAQHTPTGLVFAATAHLLTNEEGDVDAAHRLLVRALDDVADTTQASGWDCQAILYALLHVGLYTRQPEPWDLLSKAMAQLEPETVTAFRLCHDAYVDPTRNSDEIRAGIARAFADLLPDAAPWELIPLGFAAVAMDAMSDYRCVIRQMVDRERDGGAIAMVIPGLMLLCHDSYVHGHWDEAEKLADQGLELAAAYGYQFWAAQIRALLAAGAALRGDTDLALSRSAQATTWAASRGVEVTRAYARSARTIAAMGQGDFAEADLQISQSNALGNPSPAVPGRWAILHQVEAAVHAGRTNEARAHVAAAQQDGIDRISPRTALITAGAAAIAAGDGQAGPLFEAALDRPDADRWPWEHARIQFAYGKWLRRTPEIIRARLHIRAALETFEQMGAAAMAQQARDELRATGVATAGRPETPTIPMAADERQIAEPAITGRRRTRSAGREDDPTAAGGSASPALTNYALTILDLGSGRYSEALARAVEVFDQDPPKLGTQILPDLIEAAVRTGDMDAAASALERLSARTRSSGTDQASGLLARSKALLSDDGEARYREAIEHLRRPDTGIDLARAHLLYGEWLRRQRRRRDAREQLRAAQELFDSVGFAAFTHRVSVELHATSEAARKRKGDGGNGLTPQEAEIAGLVADGLSNRQVAGRMYISQNTVEYHLRKVFRKVGVRSRTQLARAMLEVSPDDQAPATGTRAVTA